MVQILKISKDGINAVTGTAPNDLIFSSEYNTLKYHQSGTINVAPAGTTAEGTVTHDLGYVPFFTAYTNLFATPNATDFNMCPGLFRSTLPPPARYVYANSYATSDKLYLRIDTNFSTTTYTFRYFIFRNNTGL